MSPCLLVGWRRRVPAGAGGPLRELHELRFGNPVRDPERRRVGCGCAPEPGVVVEVPEDQLQRPHDVTRRALLHPA